ncbi:DNA-binding transcriptional regulator, AcrR family [Paraoerskovia marina]|uniref:DNA-binding transcriptional regulator, AcrR family n=1 Tax=Paraoerskovia marina TaxID=545619 RepID=A0A1H1MDI5_9CELL|nr:TetR/AcrR family transcriptional regulator [Paraoerskovia marina]SDR84425.1 DNA-binding transcriptional regulator, AcrR family [Paraoerskovia marina]
MTTATPVSNRPASPVRERILEAATEQFYREGIRAVSADKIIAAAEISKVTFYRHFRTKDDLVVAYLEASAARERHLITEARTENAGRPLDTLRFLATVAGEVACRPGFRGCAFVNAGAEYPDADHPVRDTIATHRRWYLATFRELAEEAGADEPAEVAEELMMLRDGAMVAGHVGDATLLADRLTSVGRAVLLAHTRPRPTHAILDP